MDPDQQAAANRMGCRMTVRPSVWGEDDDGGSRDPSKSTLRGAERPRQAHFQSPRACSKSPRHSPLPSPRPKRMLNPLTLDNRSGEKAEDVQMKATLSNG